MFAYSGPPFPRTFYHVAVEKTMPANCGEIQSCDCMATAIPVISEMDSSNL